MQVWLVQLTPHGPRFPPEVTASTEVFWCGLMGGRCSGQLVHSCQGRFPRAKSKGPASLSGYRSLPAPCKTSHVISGIWFGIRTSWGPEPCRLQVPPPRHTHLGHAQEAGHWESLGQQPAFTHCPRVPGIVHEAAAIPCRSQDWKTTQEGRRPVPPSRHPRGGSPCGGRNKSCVHELGARGSGARSQGSVGRAGHACRAGAATAWRLPGPSPSPLVVLARTTTSCNSLLLIKHQGLCLPSNDL